jgi:hypothetical protein
MDIQELYKHYLYELASLDNRISITEKPFTSGNINGATGGISSYINENKIEIVIDSLMNTELKLSVLFHEYGHALHYIRLGFTKVYSMKLYENDKWEFLSEYEAFKYQIQKMKEVHDRGICDDSELLKKMISKLYFRMSNDSNKNYQSALLKLSKEDLWIDCNTI